MKKNVLKISLGAGVLLVAVCLLASYMGDIKERKETKVIKSESVNYAEGMVTYEISEESRGEIKQLVAETVKGIGVSLTDSQLEELTAKVTQEVQLKIEAQYESDINEALKGTIGGGQVTEDDIDDLKDDIEAAIKRETSKTPSVLYGELKENLRLEDTISAYLEEQGYLSTDNIATYMASKEYKDNVDARIAKAMQQNKAETSQDISKLSDQVAGDLKKSVDGLKSDISSLETQQANDKRSLEQSIRSNASSIAALESSSLAASTFDSFYSQYQIDKQYLDEWKSQTSSDISTLSDTVSSNDQANQQRFGQIESDASNLEERVGEVETAVGNIEVYVSDDGQLHYVDGTGADTALNFSSGEVYYLGTGTEFDIKSLFPSQYQRLTADNFLVIPSGTHSFSLSQPSDVDHHWTNGSFSVTVKSTPRYSYENGILQVEGSTWYRHTDKWGNQFVTNQSGTCSFTYKVYLVMGDIETL